MDTCSQESSPKASVFFFRKEKPNPFGHELSIEQLGIRTPKSSWSRGLHMSFHATMWCFPLLPWPSPQKMPYVLLEDKERAIRWKKQSRRENREAGKECIHQSQSSSRGHESLFPRFHKKTHLSNYRFQISDGEFTIHHHKPKYVNGNVPSL